MAGKVSASVQFVPDDALARTTIMPPDPMVAARTRNLNRKNRKKLNPLDNATYQDLTIAVEKPPTCHLSEYPILKIHIDTNYTWTLIYKHTIFDPSAIRTEETLQVFLREALQKSLAVRIRRLKGDRLVVAEGVIKDYIENTGGSMQILLEGNIFPVTILANFAIEMEVAPQSLLTQEKKLQRAQSLMNTKKKKAKTKWTKLENLDPYPEMDEYDLRQLFADKPANCYVIYGGDQMISRQYEGFRQLHAAFNTTPGHQSLQHLSFFLVVPSPATPQWLPYCGWFTFQPRPWDELSPNTDGAKKFVTMFDSVESFKLRFPSMQDRLAPYEVLEVKTPDGSQKAIDENPAAETGCDESEDESLTDTPPAATPEVEIKEEEEEVEYKHWKRQAFVTLLKPFCFVIVIGSLAVGVTWFFLNRQPDELADNIIAADPIPETNPPPQLLALLFSVFLRGVDGTTLGLQAVRDAWVEGVRLDLDLPDSAGIAIVQVQDEESGRRDFGGSSKAGDRAEALPTDIGMRLEAFEGGGREQLGRRAGGGRVKVSTRVEMLLTAAHSQLAASAAQKLATASDDAGAVLASVTSLLQQRGLANFTVESVVDVGLWAGDSKQTVTTPPPDATPGPNFTHCGEYPYLSNGTGTASVSDSVRVGTSFVIECHTAMGFRPTVAGYPQVTCQEDGTFSREISCVGCGSGRFLDVSIRFEEVCRACPEGSFSMIESTTACELCPPGFYTNASGSESCIACNNLTSTPGFGATSFALCFCPPGYFGDNNGPCFECPRGTYAEVPGLTRCVRCPKFSTTADMGSRSFDACICDEGHQYNAEADVCEDCPVGFYKTNASTSQNPCTACPERATTALPAATSISQCMCEPGTVRKGETCVPCLPGSFKAFQENTTCTGCPAGTISGLGSTNCSNCPHGSFNLGGTERCQLCPLGTFAKSPASACTSCAAGEFIDRLGSACFACGAGRISSAGASSCSQCFGGTYAAAPGGVSCRTCAAGKFSRVEAGSCTDCATGFFSAQPGQSACVACADGHEARGGATACTMCSAGKFSNQATSAVCTMCGAGTFSDSDGMSACAACPISMYQPSPGQSACELCPPFSTTLAESTVSVEDCTCSAGRQLSLDGECVGYWAEGVQTKVPVSTLESGGWQLCSSRAYQLGLTTEDLLCPDALQTPSRFLFGARARGSSVMEVLAMGTTSSRAPTQLPTATQENFFDPMQHNGVYWYKTPFAFGFSAVPVVQLGPHDFEPSNCSKRISWDVEGQGGYRAGCVCGACEVAQDLSTSTFGEYWLKEIYFHIN